MAKFLELEGLSGKHIINTNNVSSVHEDSHDGIKFLTVKLTDGSTIHIDMEIKDFHKLLTDGETSQLTDNYFK